jgi:hypothetical protein
LYYKLVSENSIYSVKMQFSHEFGNSSYIHLAILISEMEFIQPSVFTFPPILKKDKLLLYYLSFNVEQHKMFEKYQCLQSNLQWRQELNHYF